MIARRVRPDQGGRNAGIMLKIRNPKLESRNKFGIQTLK